MKYIKARSNVGSCGAASRPKPPVSLTTQDVRSTSAMSRTNKRAKPRSRSVAVDCAVTLESSNVLVQRRAACRRVLWNVGLGVTPQLMTPKEFVGRGVEID